MLAQVAPPSLTVSPHASPPQVLCWVAGGPGVGLGHVMRSLELARSLEKVGLRVGDFACNADPASRAAIAAAGRQFRSDTSETLPAADVVLVDRPEGVDRRVLAWQVDHPRARIAALDSFDMESGHADLVVNLHNHHPSLRRPVSPRVDYHEGPEFAIIRREFVAARFPRHRAPSRARELVVCFGGADPCDHTGLVLDAIACGGLPGVSVRVVIGPAFSAAAATAARARSLGAEPLERVPNLAPWFARADLAVCGGGTTMLELACVGTPALVLPQNDAEARFAAALAARGAVQTGRPSAGAGMVHDDLERLADSRPARERLSAAALTTVDGFGQDRIAAALLALLRMSKR